MIKKVASLCALLWLSVSVQAAPIYVDHSGEDYWTSMDLGLDFMDLTSTEGLTYEQIQQETTEGGLFDGWRLASGSESRALYQLFAGGVDTYQGWSATHYDNALTWFRLFGHSTYDPYQKDAWNEVEDTPSGYLYWSQIFNADKVAAHIAIENSEAYQDGWFATYNYGFTTWALDESYSNTPYAGLLTRETTFLPAEVPEPQPMALLLLGLILISARRFEKVWPR